MGTSYARSLKPAYANDFNEVMALGNKVRSILSKIVSEGTDSEELIDEVKIQMQPRLDGGLAIIGWIAHDPVVGMPDEEFDDVKEMVNQLPPPPVPGESQASSSDERNPFQRG